MSANGRLRGVDPFPRTVIDNHSAQEGCAEQVRRRGISHQRVLWRNAPRALSPRRVRFEQVGRTTAARGQLVERALPRLLIRTPTNAAHVVRAWIGNSEAVARKHHLQVTDDYFSKAVAMPENALRKALRQGAEPTGTEPQSEAARNEKTPVFPGFAELCELVHKCIVPLRGFEQSNDYSENPAFASIGAAKSGALRSRDARIDVIIAVWEHLREVDRSTLASLAFELAGCTIMPKSAGNNLNVGVDTKITEQINDARD